MRDPQGEVLSTIKGFPVLVSRVKPAIGAPAESLLPVKCFDRNPDVVCGEDDHNFCPRAHCPYRQKVAGSFQIGTLF
jgi:hypothetical protein